MASEQRPLREMALFAGAGGGILGGILLGWETICAVEINAFCARRLCQRQNEDHLPPFPVWDDVSTFEGRPWRGRVDVVSLGFPCQDISIANENAVGIEGLKSGLWKEGVRIICEVGPGIVWVENSPALTFRGMGVVLTDLAEMGYDARWGVFSAASVGAEHVRERIFILAHTDEAQCEGSHLSKRISAKYTPSKHSRWGKDKPTVDRASDGVAGQLERLGAIGNGQVPSVVKLAFQTLTEA